MTQLNSEQTAAVEAILRFLKGPEPFFVLSGAAGTGKTFTIKELVSQVKGRLIFTAPTNKATKVLQETFGEEELSGGYRPECRTIFSLLALRLEASGAVKELTKPEDPVDLQKYLAVIVDEASMINSNLWSYIQDTSEDQGVKFIFMGDAAQLPPVGEANSPVWSVEEVQTLLKVMRHDNQILNLATRLRKLVNHPAPSIKLESDWNSDKIEGVLVVKARQFEQLIREDAERGLFAKRTYVKAIAWRNITVEAMNRWVRKSQFPDAKGEFFPEDRIIMIEPARLEKATVATTDMEGTVERTTVEWHPDHGDMRCYRVVAVMDDGHPVTLWGLHPDGNSAYQSKHQRLLETARGDGRKWKQYWQFRESFHQFRYAYALTAHRAQGSTYEKVYVNAGDILANYNRQEAFRCLYVACTRPRKQLIITLGD